MTRDKALELLGLSDGYDADAVRHAYEARAAGPAQQAAGAPSPSLRSVYEKQLALLSEARDLLQNPPAPARPASSPLTETQVRDLPALERSATTSRVAFDSPAPFELPIVGTRRDYPAANPVLTGAGAAPGDEPASNLGIEPGRILADRYEIRTLLGAGGMGAVYAAFDRVRGEDVAVKVLLPHLLRDSKARDRFLNEARIASDLAHPGIVRVYDLHETAGLTFLTMELLRGRSLREEIVARKQAARRFSVEEVRSIAGQLCEALSHAHAVTVHRDVKPENVWLRDDGTVKLMDFGIARLLRPSQLTSTGMALGTAYYMAPEQLRGVEDVDHRADQFAVAVMIYELLTGEIPQGAILAPRQVRRSVPAGVSAAVMKALAGDPAKRFPDMAAFRRELLGRSSAVPVPAIAVGLVLCAGLGGAAWWFGSGAKEKAVQAAPVADPGSSADESGYVALAGEVGKLHEEAEAVVAGLQDTRTPKDEVDARVADLWHRHPQQRNWLKEGKQAEAKAKKSAERKSFADAIASLEEARTEFRKPASWRDHAREALKVLAPVRDELRKGVLSQADAPRTLTDWPEGIAHRVETGLLQEDGEEGHGEATRVAARLPDYQTLLEKRSEAVRQARAARESAGVDGVGERYQAAETCVQEADRALADDRTTEAARLYTSAEADFRAAATGLAQHLAGLLDAAKADAAAGRYGAAQARYAEYLKLRPNDSAVAALRQTAESAERLGRVRDLDRAGDRDEAVSALAGLRREHPTDPDVRSLVAEFAARLEGSGRKSLNDRRYDDAKDAFQLLRRLSPSDPKVTALVNSVDGRRREDERQDELARQREVERKLTEQKRLAELQQQIAAQQRAQEQAERDAEAERQQAAEAAARDSARRNKQQTFGAAGVPAQGGGIFVIQSNPGTPASRVHGGLEYGDVILTINGQAVNTEADYWAAVRNSPDYMKFTYRNVRNGAVYEVGVYLNR